MREATCSCVESGYVESVSIHASHAGGDLLFERLAAASRPFQSTPPMREATRLPW